MCLPARKTPYWIALRQGAHIGYYRGRRVSKWVARFRQPGGSSHYRETTLAEADDNLKADGTRILNYDQAQIMACRWFENVGLNSGPREVAHTVSDALNDYLEGLRGKDFDNTQRRIEAIIRP
jgi:hypothetical protein